MKTQLKTLAFVILTTASAIGLSQSIYKPTVAIGDQKIRLKPWGSGTIAEAGELVYDGTVAIRVSSRNFYQGGFMVFDEPRDMSQLAADPGNLLMITLQAPTVDLTMGGEKKRDEAVPLEKDRRKAIGADLSPNAKKAPGVVVFIKNKLEKVRCVITTSDNNKAEVYFDLNSTLADSKGWKTVGIPIAAIPGFDKSNKQVTSISFSGDTISSFYIGELKVKNDKTPIYVEPSVRDLNLALGDAVVLEAYGNAGSTMLKYTWDFDEKDGINIDTEGQVIKRRFMKEGTYVITLTAHDFYGLKAPVSTKIKVVVNP